MLGVPISLSTHLDITVTKFQRVTDSDINSEEGKLRGSHLKM